MKNKQKKSPQVRQHSRGMTEPTNKSCRKQYNTAGHQKKGKIMDFFFILLSLALTFGICWLIDRDNMANYAIVITFLEICNLFWLVFPKL